MKRKAKTLITVRLDPDILKWIDRESRLTGETRSEIIREIIWNHAHGG